MCEEGLFRISKIGVRISAISTGGWLDIKSLFHQFLSNIKREDRGPSCGGQLSPAQRSSGHAAVAGVSNPWLAVLTLLMVLLTAETYMWRFTGVCSR